MLKRIPVTPLVFHQAQNLAQVTCHTTQYILGSEWFDNIVQSPGIYCLGSLFEKDTYDGAQEPTKIKKHIYAGSNRVCVVDNGELRFYHGDHLGSSNLITDGAGIQIALYEYRPFGEVSTQSGNYQTDIKFTGKIQDDTGLYYYGARYYDPVIGRFITPDTIVQAPQDPQTLNRYAYCRNNPVKYVDPSGRAWFIPLLIAAFKGAMIGAAIGAGLAAITGGNIGQGALLGAISGAFFSGTAFLGKGLSGGMKILAYAEAGAYSGAIGAAAIGADPARGAGFGALSGAVFGGIGMMDPNGWSGVGRVALAGIAGGGISELAGGDFWDGFAFAGAIAGADFLSRAIWKNAASMKTAATEGKPKLDKNGNPLKGKDGKAIVLQVKYGESNVGSPSRSSYKNIWRKLENELIGETGIVMNTLGLRGPGFQGLSLKHDPTGNFIKTTFGQTAWGVVNIPTMAPIYGLNLVGSAINDNPTFIGLYKTLEDE